MNFPEIWEQLVTGLRQTTLLEYIGVFAGIICVWFSKKENILVYPIGLINTVAYIYISTKGHLLGEASVNIYYTIMSIYGWILWAKKDQQHKPVIRVQFSNSKQLLQQLLFFASFYIAIFFSLQYLQKDFAPGAIPWADALASAAAYTGMWLMAKKKVESWFWWIVTNTASIPLYFVKGYVFTSFQYIVLLILAVMGLLEWGKKARALKMITQTDPVTVNL